MIKKAAQDGQLPFTLAATMEDRYLMNQGKEQIYGTQAQITAANGIFIWPVQDPENVNKRRKEAGFTTTIEEYAKELLGDTHEYKALALADIQRL